MTKSRISIALRIAQLIEDYSAGELQEAVELLREQGCSSMLLGYLAGESKAKSQPKQRGSRNSTAKPAHETVSRAVLKLREEDPEKFRVLSEFDRMVRRDQLLTAREDLRRFGERISKDFELRKARKETISALMVVLADRPLSEIEQLVEFAASFGVAGNTDEYQRLAQFLIKGKSAG